MDEKTITDLNKALLRGDNGTAERLFMEEYRRVKADRSQFELLYQYVVGFCEAAWGYATGAMGTMMRRGKTRAQAELRYAETFAKTKMYTVMTKDLRTITPQSGPNKGKRLGLKEFVAQQKDELAAFSR